METDTEVDLQAASGADGHPTGTGADAKGDWGDLPTKLPAGFADRTRLWLASATEDAVVKITVTDVDEDDDDPECEPDDPLAPSSVVDEFCDLGCEPSDYFPPLSPPIGFGDP